MGLIIIYLMVRINNDFYSYYIWMCANQIVFMDRSKQLNNNIIQTAIMLTLKLPL